MNIRRVSNGWIVEDPTHYQMGVISDKDTHVFQTIPQLQEALPRLLGEEPSQVHVSQETIRQFKNEGLKLTAEQCLESHKKAVEEFERKGNKLPGQY